ncbi:glycoside hydrolase family 99-like domain-containing protein [Pseudomonas sp. CFBP 13719]|uniref:glycoside hydrolase family 99-like domain-containing protein n=1 Tax=Pseudomonas sp. CFBP 13719 TaxID=2775303 RepID=UPI00177C637E|nr:glycoside hydrolase family 99-like domain-containing protein [Pseudomonas sp. CFBP 13719]MBD8684812.1 glycoside hydrolase family 99-like domain-containing protein [Pseudomonas sp. CFBP 13719]
MAIELYQKALIETPALANSINFNIALAQDKLGNVNKNYITNTLSTEPIIPSISFDSTQESFVPYSKKRPPDSAVKLIAFYLPQFHPFPENDEWWGKGFTEWTNVGKAKPNYEGHNHPHCPIHLGYYDLRIPEIQEEQARLAKEYGVYGFSYYFYWFDGKTLMESPLKAMLANKKVDMPFCLTWANENWSRRWDGQENDVLIAQNHSRDDSTLFIQHLIPYFKDSRYIRIDNKPVLIIYRASIIPEINETADLWRAELVKHGFAGIYLICAQTFGIKSPEPFGFDAAVEFPPHTVVSTDVRQDVKLTNPEFTGYIFSYDQVVSNAVKNHEPEYKLFRSAMLSWDNTARKQNASHIFHGFSLLKYKQWLSSICLNSLNNEKYSTDEKIVFVNAWNEWAEGTHLEPDRTYGYAYLETTRTVLAQLENKRFSGYQNYQPIKRHDVAAIVHVHYIELWPTIKQQLKKLQKVGLDLFVTTTDSALIKIVKADFKHAHVRVVENRGRDVLPFIETLRSIHSFNYTAICKLHSKKSAYRSDGNDIREEIYNELIGSTGNVRSILDRFRANPNLGILAARKYLIKHTSHNMTFDNEIVEDLAKKMNLKFEYSHFPAGSMFWFRQRSFSRILHLSTSDFDIERGLADGTNAHGIERLFCTIVEGIGYQTEVISESEHPTETLRSKAVSHNL